MTTADGVAAQIADLDATIALHGPDDRGRCARCVRVGLCYDRSPALWPCGPYDVAVSERARLLRSQIPTQRQPGNARERSAA